MSQSIRGWDFWGDADWDDEWELTDKAWEAEELAERIAERFWLDRDDVRNEVLDVMMGDDEPTDD